MRPKTESLIAAAKSVRQTADTQAASIVPDELVRAAEEFVRRVEAGEVRSKRSYAAFKAALSLPHRTEADIRADERDRLAKLVDVMLFTRDRSEWAKWLRSQGGE
jgi:hypothetical protein